MIELRWISPTVDSELYKGERRLRYEVLRKPLGMPEGSEENAAEARCEHCVAVSDGIVVGCVLWLADTDDRGPPFGPSVGGRGPPFGPSVGGHGGKLLQMAVATDQRGNDIGRRLVRELERHVAAHGVELVRMHARESALGFYLKLGYVVTGDTFTEVGLPHRLMQRSLG